MDKDGEEGGTSVLAWVRTVLSALLCAGTSWTALMKAALKACRTASTKAGGNPTFKDMLHGNPLALPRYPIPSLKMTMQRWLESVRPHLQGRAEEWQRVKQLAKEFELGDGAILHRRLVQRDAYTAAHPPGVFGKHTYVDYHWEDLYVVGRYPCAINCNPYMALQPPPKTYTPIHSDPQVATAAAFVSAHLKYVDMILSGKFEPDAGICVHQHALQVGTARIPKRGCDTLVQHHQSQHIVVITGNRMYAIEVFGSRNKQGRRSHLSAAALASAMEGIKAAARACPPPVGFVSYMTGTDRDSWADVRAALEASNGVNMASLQAMDAALCVVALEDGPDAKAAPLMSTAAARAFLTGQCGRNRWFDKHQLCVLPSGAAAVNFEHSYSDGMAWCRNLGQVWHDMYSVPSRTVKRLPAVPTHTWPVPVRELHWELQPQILKAIALAKDGLEADCSGLSLELLDFRAFGRADIKRWGVSPDCVVQMAFQAAYYALHGRLPAVYESATTHRYHHGRTETIRTVTSASLRFIQALQPASGASKVEKRKLLGAASAKHRENARASNAAMGVERHFYVLKLLARELATGAELMGKAFFNDPVFELTSTWVCSTSNVAHPFLAHFGFGPVTSAGYGLGYMTQADYIPICISSFAAAGTDASAMARHIEATLLHIQDICN
eukprot:TRINITY_DN5571_c0_g2_i1.p1 TRINITY_DN5571_c0_g2~~TRINITY_DN5571_c0_g2_i1.p1  ORF type:complete len:669 (+),score=125.01 TRINITY_DN5571_c0_g2_i1:127-2133(+)